MNSTGFIEKQIREIQQGGRTAFVRKICRCLLMLLRLPLYVIAIPILVIIRGIRPFLLIRLGGLISCRIGHFAANTELYLCERDAGINVPPERHLDLLYFALKPICNQQLATMWKRILRIWPAWILGPIAEINRLIPGGKEHDIGHNTQNDRDVHNLLDRYPPHLQFTAEEIARGEAGLRRMGIPEGSAFVCLTVRDNAYLNHHFKIGDFSPQDYRDSDIQNYVLAAETLANLGYFVIRMGAKVNAPLKSNHPKVIDYATNGMRTDFMDIYLGSKCFFAISTQTGWDAVPYIFRKPICYVNIVPIGYFMTFEKNVLSLSKRHYLKALKRELSLREIFTHGVGLSSFTSEYKTKGVELIENTPEEIRDIVIEMAERLNGTWHDHKDDEALQKRFWEIFPKEVVDVYQGRPLHGVIHARYGAAFLRNNRTWLQ